MFRLRRHVQIYGTPYSFEGSAGSPSLGASEGVVDYTFPESVTSYSRYWKSFATLSLSKRKQSFAGVVMCPHRTGKGEVLEWQGAKSELIEP